MCFSSDLRRSTLIPFMMPRLHLSITCRGVPSAVPHTPRSERNTPHSRTTYAHASTTTILRYSVLFPFSVSFFLRSFCCILLSVCFLRSISGGGKQPGAGAGRGSGSASSTTRSKSFCCSELSWMPLAISVPKPCSLGARRRERERSC